MGNIGPMGNMMGANPLRDLQSMPVMKEIGDATKAIKGPPGQFQEGVGNAVPKPVDTGFVGPTDQGQRLAFLRAFGGMR